MQRQRATATTNIVTIFRLHGGIHQSRAFVVYCKDTKTKHFQCQRFVYCTHDTTNKQKLYPTRNNQQQQRYRYYFNAIFFCWLLPLSLAISLTHSFSRTTFRSDCLIKPEKCYFTRSLLPSTLRFVVVAVVLYCILLMLFSSSFFFTVDCVLIYIHISNIVRVCNDDKFTTTIE